jgi:hypothetical protein
MTKASSVATAIRREEPDLSEFMTTGEVAELYGVNQVDVQKAIKRGLLNAQKVGYFYVLWKHSLPKVFPSNS